MAKTVGDQILPDARHIVAETSKAALASVFGMK